MPTRLIVGIASAALLAAGCASSNSHSSTPAGGSTPSTPAVPAGSSSAPVGAAGAAFVYAAGGHLFTTGGKALYTFTADTKTTSACTGACATEWPPFVGTPKAGGGVDGDDLGSFMRADGTTQVTFYGKQLYEFAPDSNGSLKGNNVADGGGTWKAAVASADDAKANGGASPAPGGGGASSSSSSGGGGYGY